MSKPIILTLNQWHAIYQDIARNHPHSVLLVRPKMRRVLGFVSRTHREWKTDPNFGNKYVEEMIHLDFYNEPKRTMFLLKYSEYLDKSGKNSLD